MPDEATIASRCIINTALEELRANRSRFVCAQDAFIAGRNLARIKKWVLAEQRRPNTSLNMTCISDLTRRFFRDLAA